MVKSLCKTVDSVFLSINLLYKLDTLFLDSYPRVKEKIPSSIMAKKGFILGVSHGLW